MQVVAIKAAQFNDTLLGIGDELDIPDNTKGSWFALAGSAEAEAAKTIKKSGSVPFRVLQAHGTNRPISLADVVAGRVREPSTLSEIALSKSKR
jgi:hypothetical protein